MLNLSGSSLVPLSCVISYRCQLLLRRFSNFWQVLAQIVRDNQATYLKSHFLWPFSLDSSLTWLAEIAEYILCCQVHLSPCCLVKLFSQAVWWMWMQLFLSCKTLLCRVTIDDIGIALSRLGTIKVLQFYCKL